MNGRCHKVASLRLLLPWMVVALLLHPRLLVRMGNSNNSDASVLLFVQGRFQHPRQQQHHHHPRYYYHHQDDDQHHRDRDRRRQKLNPRGWFLPANSHSSHSNISNSNQTQRHHHHAAAAALEETTTTATVGAAPPAHPRTAAATTATTLSVVGGAAAAAASSSDEDEARNDVPEDASSQQDQPATTPLLPPSQQQQGEPATPEQQQQQPAAFVQRKSHRAGKLQDQMSRTTNRGGTNPGGSATAASETATSTALLSHLVLVLRALGPALVAVFGSSNNQQQRLLPFRSLYAWTLAGTSLGFYRFLYFLSLGYCLGIGLAVLACLVRYRRQVPAPWRSATAVLHSALVAAWAVRLFAHLWWREHRNWPALHRKMVQVDRDHRPSRPQRIACWLLGSFLYACLLSPCWLCLEAEYRRSLLLRTTAATPTRRFRSSEVVSAAGLALQVTGLLLESVADWQKSRFKAQQRRYQWCRDGLWRHSTHPNYAGEFLFWLGTAIAALPAILLGTTSVVGNNTGSSRRHMSAAVPLVQLAVVLLGLAALSAALAGAARRLGDRQVARYGGDPDYVSHRERTGVFGPRRWWWWLPTATKNNNNNNSNSTAAAVDAVTDVLDHNETTTTTGETPPEGTATDKAA